MSAREAWWFAMVSCEIALIACSPVQISPTVGASCGTMCESFRHAGCRAGAPSLRLGITCEGRCEAQLRTMATRPPITCVTAAHGVQDAIEACGERCSR